MTADKKLLREWTPFEYDKKILLEQRDTTGKMMLKGIIQRANTLNQNGRIYPQSILEREVINYQKLIKENRALGECDHPDSSVVFDAQKASRLFDVLQTAWDTRIKAYSKDF